VDGPSAVNLMSVMSAAVGHFSRPAECALRDVPFDESVVVRTELQWAGTVLALLLLDRWSLSRLGHAGRELAMGGLQQLIADRSEEAFASDLSKSFNIAQARSGRWEVLLPVEGDTFDGTFCGEFARDVVRDICPERETLTLFFTYCTAHTAGWIFKAADGMLL
jgi:hypothetical protein